MTGLARNLAAASAWVSRASAAVCVVLIFVMLALLSAQVVLRYFFGAPPSWTEEVSITLFAWVVLLYATVGVRERFHAVVDLLPASLDHLRAMSDRLVLLFILGFGVAFLYAGIQYVQRTEGQLSAALQFPISYLYLSVPVSGALLVFHALAMILAPADPPPAPDFAHE